MFNNQERKEARLVTPIDKEISDRTYNIFLGIIVCYGLILSGLIGTYCTSFVEGLNPIIFLIGYFVSCIIGIILSTTSTNPIVSFIGYNLVVLPIGLVLSTCLYEYNLETISSAIMLTGIVVAIMIVISSIKPDIFRGMGLTLFISLTIGIIVEIISYFLGYNGNLFDYIFIIIFSLYLGYDWCRAQDYPKTYDNAIDSALDIYLDIINLFIRILSILGNNRDD